MIALIRTTDTIKLGAVRALLEGAGLETQTFDDAAGALWAGLIPVRLMVGEGEADTARRLLREAGFIEGADGDWDLKRPQTS
jgi:hypothetical protein